MGAAEGDTGVHEIKFDDYRQLARDPGEGFTSLAQSIQRLPRRHETYERIFTYRKNVRPLPVSEPV